MRMIMVMYDTLNRRTLPNYGGCEVSLPNFERVGRETVTFDNSYVGSLPCMPARREMHTGRLNFLHRGWGPIEPFDDSVPEMLKMNGIYTHLASDHYHYWEDGGATYHSRFNSWELSRGQENDTWMAELAPHPQTHTFGANPFASMKADTPAAKYMASRRDQNMVNRESIRQQGFTPQTEVFDRGLAFIEHNHAYDNWYLQIETFDPHEPFDAPEEDQAEFGVADFPYDWPPQGPVREDDAFVDKVRKKYLALLKSCDRSLGRVLDMMDKYDMWKDTMLIVNTDHGFLLGEHDWWSKNRMPMYNEICNTPLFIWDPRCGKKGERRAALVQTIDLAPTILGFFGLQPTADMMGKDLAATIAEDAKVRDYALYGMFGGHVNITDGHHVYMRAPVAENNQPCNEYTLMPTDMANRKSIAQMQEATLHEAFSFTKEMPVLQLPVRSLYFNAYSFGDAMYCLDDDPRQLTPIEDEAKKEELLRAMVREMQACDAPDEQYDRVGLRAYL